MPRRARSSFPGLLLTVLGLGLVLVLLTRVLRSKRPAPAIGEPLRVVRPEPVAAETKLAAEPVVEAAPAPAEREPEPAPVKKAVAKKKAAAKRAASAPARAAAAWVDPDGNVCPTSHPIKAKLSSKLFHLPGMFAYDRTNPDRCYRDEAAAEADGLRRAKR